MKELLETCFGKHYQSTKQVSVNCKTLKGQIPFADPKACADCKIHTPEQEATCDKVVLYCNTSDQEIDAIELESFIDNYKHLKNIPSGKKCDLLLVGENKIVFCDLTCSLSKYIDLFVMADGTPKTGKRTMVRTQIGNAIALLMAVPEIATTIDLKTDKVAMFAYREKPDTVTNTFDKRIVETMRSFGVKTDKVLGKPMFSDMGNGFVFTEVRYPEPYVW